MTRASAGRCWWRPFKTFGTAHVVHVDLRENSPNETVALAWLDDEEHERRERFLFKGPRRRFALCRAALRILLCDRLGCVNTRLEFEAAEHGKPFAFVDGIPNSIGFNVSHSGDHGLIAFSPDGRVGVDVEERVARRNMDLLIEGVFSQAERSELASKQGCEKSHLFYRLWTIKEALIKAHGMGFSLDVSQFEVPLDMLDGESKSSMRLPQSPQVTWQVEDLGNERFAAAVAIEVT